MDKQVNKKQFHKYKWGWMRGYAVSLILLQQKMGKHPEFQEGPFLIELAFNSYMKQAKTYGWESKAMIKAWRRDMEQRQLDKETASNVGPTVVKGWKENE